MLEATGDPKCYTSDLDFVCDTQKAKLDLGMLGPCARDNASGTASI